MFVAIVALKEADWLRREKLVTFPMGYQMHHSSSLVGMTSTNLVLLMLTPIGEKRKGAITRA